MADTKITGLTAMTTPTDDDLMVVVDSPGASPETKKITWANVKATLITYLATLGLNFSGGNIGLGTVPSGTYKVEISTTLGVGGVITGLAPIRLFGYTVAGLPAGTVGYMAYCTNLLAPTFGATVVGGGSIVSPVFYNGTNWISF